MTPSHRRLRADGDDYWRVREFLRAAFLANDRRLRAWHVARFDYACWHVLPNAAGVALADVAWVWEVDGALAALLMPDGGPGEAHGSPAPRARGVELETAMLGLAEAELAVVGDDGRRRLVVWAHADDPLRGGLLAGRGYRRTGVAESEWRRRLDAPVAVPPAPLGYEVRALGEGLELLERCFASGLAFHDGDVGVALDNRADPSWYRSVQRAPLYRRCRCCGGEARTQLRGRRGRCRERTRPTVHAAAVARVRARCPGPARCAAHP
jgi:hypothetical protein